MSGKRQKSIESATPERVVWRHAPEDLKAHSSIMLTNEKFDAFYRACEAPSALSEEILNAAKALDRKGFSLNAEC